MALSTNAPKQTNWWIWGGAAAAAIALIVALGYAFDWFGAETADTAAPAAVEQVAPATE